MDFYNKYHFTFHDVIKRHERILNCPKDWEIRIVACMFLIVTIINLLTLSVFCSEIEDVNVNVLNGLNISSSRNYFDASSYSLGYFQLEPGYIYHIVFNTGGPATGDRHLAISENAPALNGTYNYLGTLSLGNTYDYIANDNEYLYFSYFQQNDAVSVTREKIQGYNGAVEDLVNNVGVNQIWGVFENGISFVGVVVLVAFGLFLVVLAIRKISKGKSEF